MSETKTKGVMVVRCITIGGENCIISAEQFDFMAAEVERARRMDAVMDAVGRVLDYDWSSNDEDAYRTIEQLRIAVDNL